MLKIRNAKERLKSSKSEKKWNLNWPFHTTHSTFFFFYINLKVLCSLNLKKFFFKVAVNKISIVLVYNVLLCSCSRSIQTKCRVSSSFGFSCSTLKTCFCILLEYKVLEMTLKVLLSNKLQKLLKCKKFYLKIVLLS